MLVDQQDPDILSPGKVFKGLLDIFIFRLAVDYEEVLRIIGRRSDVADAGEEHTRYRVLGIMRVD